MAATKIERMWFQSERRVSPLLWLLAPLTVVFWLLSSLRRLLYRVGVKRTERVPVPVVVVGNITVGGNGKTPLVIRLAQWLRQQGMHPGVISRGYGGNAKEYPCSVEPDSDPLEVGDEPVLMRQHLPCPLVVDPNRSRGARYLVEHHKCDVIISDDGLQHYKLGRDIEIAVIDGQRRFGNECLLPMGPLREGLWRLGKVDFAINNGGHIQNGEHLMTLEPGRLVNVKYPSQTKSTSDLMKPVTAAAAIGNPKRFFQLLEQKQLKLKACLEFPDHHQFSDSDLPQDTVLMTEKDAVKCRSFAHDDWWYLPVSAKLSEEFKTMFMSRLATVMKTRKRENHGV